MSMHSNLSRNIIVVLHNVRSAANVGSILRTSDGAGVAEVWCTGYTPIPAPRGRKYLTRAQKSLAKSALGAERSVPWRRSRLLSTLIRQLRSRGFLIVGLEQDTRSIDITGLPKAGSIALIAGNEVRGLDRRILCQCDAIVELPMYGQKNSLNVSVACGIALYALRGIISTGTKDISREVSVS